MSEYSALNQVDVSNGGTAPAEPQLGVLVPCRSRAERIDLELRRRLGASLTHICDVVRVRDADEPVGLDRVQQRLAAGPVSPWVFCLYSKLVAELTKHPTGDVAGALQDVLLAASQPAHPGIVAFGNPTLPRSWWDHFHRLLDTDRERPFKLQAPDMAVFALAQREIGEGLALLEGSDVDAYDELCTLLRMIVLGSPADHAHGFGGASTFFFWGGTLLNAAVRRSAVAVIDLLVHESSHGLLFGLSAGGPLTRNSGHERFSSPLRSDKRPIDGIFHACFVTTRVHLVMTRLIESRSLSATDASAAAERRDHNGSAARQSLDLLQQHAALTEHGETIVGELHEYWRAVKGD